jgi:3-dehydroquinate synthetase
MAHIEKDKKNDIPGITRFVLPKAAGKMIVQHIDNETVHQAVSHFLEA